MLDNDVVRYEVRDRKAYVTINRPQAMNALSAEVIAKLKMAFAAVDRDNDVLVAILAGEGGRAFSAGGDLKEMTAHDSAGGNPVFDDVEAASSCARSVKPVIAAIDGFAVAGGFELALTCDMRIATAQSRFGMPEPRHSLLGGYGLHHLSRMIPLGEALHMQLSGITITAQRAYEIGLLQAVEPDRESMFRKVDLLADEILRCAPLAVQAIKRIVTTGRNLPVEYSFKLARPIEEMVYATEDRIEGPKAFAEKRRPVWKGK